LRGFLELPAGVARVGSISRARLHAFEPRKAVPWAAAARPSSRAGTPHPFSFDGYPCFECAPANCRPPSARSTIGSRPAPHSRGLATTTAAWG